MELLKPWRKSPLKASGHDSPDNCTTLTMSTFDKQNAAGRRFELVPLSELSAMTPAERKQYMDALIEHLQTPRKISPEASLVLAKEKAPNNGDPE